MAFDRGTTETEGLEISQLRRMVDVAADLTQESREQSEGCRDYYDSHQFTDSELAVFKKRKQPPLVINRIKRKIDAVVGIEQKGRVDPRALPRNPDDEDAADVATKALVFVDDICRFDQKRSAFCYNLAIEGTGGVEVTVKECRGKGGKTYIDPDILRLRWEEIFYDPFSRELDFSDAGYMGTQKWMTIEKAVEFCGDQTDMSSEELSEMLTTAMDGGATGDTYEDRPKSRTAEAWGDRGKRRAKLAQMYYLHGGEWRRVLFCGSGVISDGPSPFLDDEKKPANAMVLQSCYIDRENRRSGLVLDMIPMQDEVNKRRSKLLHMLNSRQTMGQKGAVVDVAKMKRELAQPDGHVEYDQDPQSSRPSFEVIQNGDQVAGQFELLQESKSEIDMLGPNASLLGQLEGQNSGRAIIAQQQAGMAELAPFYDSLSDWTLRVYRAVWCRIQQYWTEERWIRVTDENEKLRFVGINTPAQQPVMDPMTGQPAMGPDGQPAMQPVIGPDGQPQLENRVSDLDVDIIIDMTPEYASLQVEEFQSLVELAKSGMVPIPPQVLIKASQLRNKAEILQMMQDPAEMQAKQQAMQMEMQGKAAEIKEMEASALLKQAQAQKAAAEAAVVAPEQPGQPAPADPKPMIDAQMKHLALREQAREHDGKMELEWAKFQSDAEVKAATAEKTRTDAALAPAQFRETVRSGRESAELARNNAATDSKVKDAQAKKLLRPDPKPKAPK